jgi:hypothetical protein
MTSREAEGSRGPRVQRMAVREEQRAVWGEQRRAGGGGSANPGGSRLGAEEGSDGGRRWRSKLERRCGRLGKVLVPAVVYW